MIETLVFDEGQITCPTNGLNPQWGGTCHTLSGNAGRTVVIIKEQEKSMNYTKEDAIEVMNLAEEFLNGDNSPEANKLRETIRKNAEDIFGGVEAIKERK